MNHVGVRNRNELLDKYVAEEGMRLLCNCVISTSMIHGYEIPLPVVIFKLMPKVNTDVARTWIGSVIQN